MLCYVCVYTRAGEVREGGKVCMYVIKNRRITPSIVVPYTQLLEKECIGVSGLGIPHLSCSMVRGECCPSDLMKVNSTPSDGPCALSVDADAQCPRFADESKLHALFRSPLLAHRL